ncbi:MAG: SGNH/GDSL hydrolase family protein [Microbacteriaceae bacterium]
MTIRGRSIVLREFTPLLDRTVTPSEEYLTTTDGSLAAESFALRVDANGFLETGNPVRGTTPLYILGDSFSEAVFEHEDRRFSSIVERKLTAAGLNYRVLNASYSRATTLHMLNVLINKVLSGSITPGTTVIYFRSQVDVQIESAVGSYWNDFGLYSPLQPTNASTDEITHLESHDHDGSRRLLNTMVDVCEEFEIRLLLGTAPARRTNRADDEVLQKYFANDSQWQARMRLRREANELVRQVAASRGIPLIDADRHFEIQGGGLYDFTHMNSAGQVLLADLLLDHMVALR